MSSLDRKHRPGLGGETALLGVLITVLVAGPVTLYGIITLGHRLRPRPEALPEAFWPRSLGVFTEQTPWRGTETTLAIITAVLVLVLLTAGGLYRGRKHPRKIAHDRAAACMATVREVGPFTEKQATAKAGRLGVDRPGILIGRMVRGGHRLYATWDDTLLHIWGSRTGKTTTQAAPSIIEAPGPVIATSNKRDLSDLTRDLRAQQGQVWVFDPQNLAGEQPAWWWNPLSYVTDSERAAEMAANFSLGSRESGSRGDAYFDSAGKDLLAGLLLAAAAGNRPIAQVHTWLSRPADRTAVDLLDAAGWVKEADAVGGVMSAPDKQREGVYGTARQMAACLKNEKVSAWINPSGSADPRPRFVPEDFVRGPHTLYALSKEGAGTAGPLVTSLTVAVATAAEDHARTQPGGRLATPMLCVLDEAANVCRWASLPDLYSHYGSRGIVISTFLQSWSQGVEVWGESGMRKLFSTANVLTYGGNVKEEQFLKMLSELIGQYRYTSVSTSRQKDARSVSRQDSTDDILSVADLAALPRGRAVMLGSGARAVLLRTLPVSERSYADQAAASARAHNTSARKPAGPPPAAGVNRWISVVGR